MEFELDPYDNGLTVLVSDELLHEAIGEQGIMSDAQGREFFYLAGLALGCRTDPDYSIERTLMEFIRNTDSVNVTRKEANAIEELLG